MRRLSLILVFAAAGLLSACGAVSYDYPPENCMTPSAPCPPGNE